MKTRPISILWIAILIPFMVGCPEVQNPFDPDFPKDDWTPENFNVEVNGNVIELVWEQSITNISGFKIERKVGEGEWSLQAKRGKAERKWTDENILGGQLHTYRIHAYAGDYSSNKVEKSVTPLIMATAVAKPVTDLTYKGALLHGEVNPNGIKTTISFQYKQITENEWNTVKAVPETLTGNSAQKVKAELNDLAPEKSYHFKVLATNEAGTTESENQIEFLTEKVILILSSLSLEVSSTSAQKVITITSNIEDLKITVDVNWLYCDISEDKITITIEANESTDPRQAIITISGSGKSKEIIVTQLGTNVILDVTPDTRSILWSATSTFFSVNSNIDWAVQEASSWLTATKSGENTINITCSTNQNSTSRTAHIKVYNNSKGIEKTVTVLQEGQ